MPGDHQGTSHTSRGQATALAALTRLRELKLRGGPGKDVTALTKPMANALTQLTGLMRLEAACHSLSEQQLSSICGLTNLTHISFATKQLGVLLRDHLKSLLGFTGYSIGRLELAPGRVSVFFGAEQGLHTSMPGLPLSSWCILPNLLSLTATQSPSPESPEDASFNLTCQATDKTACLCCKGTRSAYGRMACMRFSLASLSLGCL